jgi:hypothetical protein
MALGHLFVLRLQFCVKERSRVHDACSYRQSQPDYTKAILIDGMRLALENYRSIVPVRRIFCCNNSTP